MRKKALQDLTGDEEDAPPTESAEELRRLSQKQKFQIEELELSVKVCSTPSSSASFPSRPYSVSSQLAKEQIESLASQLAAKQTQGNRGTDVLPLPLYMAGCTEHSQIRKLRSCKAKSSCCAHNWRSQRCGSYWQAKFSSLTCFLD